MPRSARWASAVLVVALAAALAWWLSRGGDAGPAPLGALADGPAAPEAPEAAPVTDLAGGAPRRVPVRPVATGRSSLVGRVTRRGEGIAAEVEVHEVGDSALFAGGWRAGSRSWLDAAFARPASSADALRATRSSDDGAYAVEGLRPAVYRIVAVAPDGARGVATATILADGARVEADVAVAAGAETLRGRVVHADGRPWRGQVAVDPRGDNNRWPDAAPPGPLVETDEAGRFSFGGLDPGAVVVVAYEGRAVARSRTVPVPYGGEFLWTVDAGGTACTVRVLRDDDGTPVAGAEVVATGAGRGTDTSNLAVRATTDAEGRAAVVLHEGSGSSVMVRAAGFAPSLRQSLKPVAGEEVVVRLARGAAIHGRVTRATDGAPAEGLSVGALPGSRVLRGWSPEPATTDAQGRYELADLGPGEWTVLAEGLGWTTKGAEALSRREGWNPLVLTVAAGARVAHDLVVVRGARLSGVVLDADGAPVGGAVVRANAEEGRFGAAWAAPPVAATGADGRFVLEGLRDGSSYQLDATAAGRVPARAGPFAAGAEGGAAVEVKFPPARFVVVSVLDDASGAPVAGARLAGGGRQGAVWATAADGSARVGPVAAEGAVLSVGASGFVSVGSWPVPDGATGVVRLRPALELSGVVRLAGGAPAAGAMVHLQAPEGGLRVYDAARSDGSFRLRGVPAGLATLWVYFESDGANYTTTATAEAGRTDVVVDLAKGEAAVRRRLVVRVTGPDGARVAWAQVQVSSLGRSASGFVEDGRGTVELQDAFAKDAPAEVEVFGARGGDGAPLGAGPAKVPLPAGATEVEVRLSAGLAVTGRVVGPDGAPVAGALVTAFVPAAGGRSPNRGASHGQARTDAAGAFRILGLGPDAYDLSASVPQEFVAPAPLRVRGGEEGAEIRLRRGVQPVLTVVDAAGAPVRGAQVQVVPGVEEVPWAERRRFAPVQTDAVGVVRLPALDPDQRHQLTIWPPSDAFAPLQRADWLPRDETLRLDRRLAVAGFVRDRAGEPVAGAVVSVEAAPGNWNAASTDETGRFQVTGVKTGEVVARVSLGGPTLLETRLRAGTTDAVLVVDTGLSLVVRVVGIVGWTQGSLHILRGGAWITVHRSAAAGAPLRFQGLEPGDVCTLWVAPHGPTPESARSAYVSGLRPGADVTVRAEPGQSIRGRLLAPAGAQNLGVRATREGGVEAWGQVQGDGRFEVPGLPEGRWTLSATAQTPAGWAMGEAPADAGGTVDLDLKPVPR